MPTYYTKYHSHFTNSLSEDYELLLEVQTFPGDPQELLVTDCQVRSTGGDEDRLAPMLGKELLVTYRIGPTDTADLSDFVADQDNEIRVTLNYLKPNGDNNLVFQGFIVVEDNNKPFQDRPFDLSIRALDGLGRLKGMDFVDTNGLLFVGSFTVIEWIAQILYKTDQTLPIRVYFNFFPENIAEISAFDNISLNSITFSVGDSFNVNATDPTIDINITEANDCFTALEKIIRCFRCRIFMENGCWHIVNLWEYMNPEGFCYVEFKMLDPVSGFIPIAQTDIQNFQDYSVQIGKNQVVSPVGGDATLYLKVPTKWVKLTFNHDQSPNKVCNQDLTEGNAAPSFDETISSSIIDSTITPVVNLTTFGYDLYCYSHFQGPASPISGFPRPYPQAAATTSAFIREVRDALGYVMNRFMVIDTISTQFVPSCVRTNRFLIDINDVLQISYQFRHRIGVTLPPGFQHSIYVYLYGDDGTFWALNGSDDGGGTSPSPNQWVPMADATFADPTGGSPPVQSTMTNQTQWNSGGINNNAQTFVKTPVSGSVEIIFTSIKFNVNDFLETWIQDINITIVPYLAGTYRQQLKGDYNYSSIDPTINIKQTESDVVEISDSPKRYFKGALLDTAGTTLIPPAWHRRGLNITERMRFTQAMERIMWNLLSRMVYKIEGTFRGALYQTQDLDYKPAGYLNVYYFADGDFTTKKFILTSFDRNLTSGQGRHLFVEVVKDANTDPFINPAISPNQFKFDYIFQ